jgi:hypothetical protein
MIGNWSSGGLRWRIVSVAVLVLSACAPPPDGGPASATYRAAPGAERSSEPAGQVSPTGIDAASTLLLRRIVAQQLAKITPDQNGAPTGFHAVHAASGLHLKFGPSGVEAAPTSAGPAETDAPWRWRMTLAGLGYADEPPSVGSADMVLTDERLEYRRRSVVEWYRNEPERLEQGFTLAERPASGPDGQPLRFTLTVDSDLTPRLDEAEQAITWVDADGRAGPRYSGLHAFDAHRQEVPSRLALWRGGVALDILDDDAEYPLTIDPWLEQAHPVANDGAQNDSLGLSIAVSGDTAIVGAPWDDTGSNPDQGSAYVFVRSGTAWSQQAKLVAGDGNTGDISGFSVTISGDTAVVGAFQDDVGANQDQGSVYVFTRSDTTWVQQQQLVASDGVADGLFGLSVALSGDTLMVGARTDTAAPRLPQGVAYVFTRSGAGLAQQQKLIPSDATIFNGFGLRVAISGDTAIISAPSETVGGNTGQGSAYVFGRSGATWIQQQKLVANDGGPFSDFGNSVAISGETAIIGSPSVAIGSNPNQGAAYIFTRSGNAWAHQQKLVADDGGAHDLFGINVAISGNTVVVGAERKSVGPNQSQGAAYVFSRSRTTWTQQQRLTASDGASDDAFGHSVAYSGDTIVVGASADNVGNNGDQGSAYVFTNPCAPRPNVRVTTARGQQAGQLQVTVAANDLPPVSGNTVQVVAFDRLDNGAVTIPNGPAGASQPFSYTLPSPTTTFTFTVNRDASNAYTTVRLRIIDACGAWPTFVGGGSTSF